MPSSRRLALALSCAAIVLAPTSSRAELQCPEGLGPALELSEPVVGPAMGDQRGAGMADNGDHYLVVWRDLTRGMLVGSLMTADGTLAVPELDIAPSVEGPSVIGAFAHVSDPAVAHNGDHFVVVYADGVALHVTRVTDEGVVLDAAPIALAADHRGTPRLASDGHDVLAVWTNPGAQLVGATIGRDGTVGEARVLSGGVTAGDAALAWTGSSYFVAWSTEQERIPGYPRSVASNIYGAVVAADGAPDPSGPLALAQGSRNDLDPALAWSGSELMLVWLDDGFRSRLGSDLRALRLTASGAPLAGATTVATATTDTRGLRPSVTWGGNGYLVAWTSCLYNFAFGLPNLAIGCSYRARALAAGGAPVGGSFILDGLVETEEYARQTVGALGGSWLVLQRGHVFGMDAASDVLAVPVTQAPMVAVPVSRGPEAQGSVSVANGDGSYLAAWQDERTRDIVVRAYTDEGTPLGPTHIIGRAVDVGRTEAARLRGTDVTFDGTQFWVAWQRFHRRVALDGTPLDAAPVAHEAFVPPTAPRLASDGARVLVVSIDDGTFANDQYLNGRLLGVDGSATTLGTFASVRKGFGSSWRYDVSGFAGGLLVAGTFGFGLEMWSYPATGGGAYASLPASGIGVHATDDGQHHVLVTPWAFGSRWTSVDAGGAPLASSVGALPFGPIVSGGAHVLQSNLVENDFDRSFEVRRATFDGLALDPDPMPVATAVPSPQAIASSGDSRWLIAYRDGLRLRYRMLDGRCDELEPDVTPPTLACPADLTAPAADSVGAWVGWTSPEVVGEPELAPGVTCDVSSPWYFYVGTTVVTCSVADRFHNVGQCTFAVTVTCEDVDGDGLCAASDPCPLDVGNDADGDGYCESVDSCPDLANPDQADADQDGDGDVCDADDDNDGVLDAADTCPRSPAGAVIDPDTGCTLDELCPCAGPRDTTEEWTSHGRYVTCVVDATAHLEDRGLITRRELRAARDAARASTCGRDACAGRDLQGASPGAELSLTVDAFQSWGAAAPVALRVFAGGAEVAATGGVFHVPLVDAEGRPFDDTSPPASALPGSFVVTRQPSGRVVVGLVGRLPHGSKVALDASLTTASVRRGHAKNISFERQGDGIAAWGVASQDELWDGATLRLQATAAGAMDLLAFRVCR